MTNGNDMLEWEETNIERLTEMFLERHKDDWELFKDEQFNNRFG